MEVDTYLRFLTARAVSNSPTNLHRELMTIRGENASLRCADTDVAGVAGAIVSRSPASRESITGCRTGWWLRTLFSSLISLLSNSPQCFPAVPPTWWEEKLIYPEHRFMCETHCGTVWTAKKERKKKAQARIVACCMCEKDFLVLYLSQELILSAKTHKHTPYSECSLTPVVQ